MIYVLYGQPGSGKTTLGKLLAEHLDTPFMIDGDEFREMFTNKNYGREGREENIRNANAVATYLNKKGKGGHGLHGSGPKDGEWKAIYVDVINGWKSHPINKETHVVMCLVNPYKHLRDELRENNGDQVVEILLQSDRELRKGHHVEDFEAGALNRVLNTDRNAIDSWSKLKEILEL